MNLQELEDHVKATRANLNYAIHRYDILMVAVPSGGLALVMTLISDLSTEPVDTSDLRFCLGLFATALISNLVSYIPFYAANYIELHWTWGEMDKLQDRVRKMTTSQDWKTTFKTALNRLISVLNLLSIVTLLWAIGELCLFMSRL